MPTSRTLLRLLVPSIPCAAGLLAFAGICLMPSSVQLLSWDTPLHLYLGQHMLQTGELLAADPGLWPGQPLYIDHEWLQQLVLAACHQALGLEGLVLYTAAGVGMTFWLTAAWMRDRGIGALTTLGLLAAAFFLLRPYYYARPFLATWILAVAWALLLDRSSRGKLPVGRWLAIAAPLMLVWVNLHGGFFLGFYLLGLFGLAELWQITTRDAAERPDAWKRLMWLATGGNLFLIVSVLNVYGIKLHFHFIRYLASSELISRITEWRTPAFHQGEALPLLLWLGFAIFVWLAAPRRLTASELVLVVGLLLTALKARRNVPMFVMLTLPVLGAQLDGLIARLGGSSALLARPARWIDKLSGWVAAGERHRGGVLAAAVVVILAFRSIGVDKVRPVDLGAKFPVAAASFIEEHPEIFRGRMFNRYQWGGYLAWELLPDHPAFINGLQDHFGEAHYRTYRGVVDLIPGWDVYLAQAGVEWVIFGANTPLTAALTLHPDWRRVYQDVGAEIWVRGEPASE